MQLSVKHTPNPEGVGAHPFGGCAKLFAQYRTVGSALLSFEGRHSVYRKIEATQNFRELVAFVPVEVLDSYREDLLDGEITDEVLFIKRQGSAVRSFLLIFSGLSGALAIGLHAASVGASLVASFALTVSLSLPFGMMWHFAPRGHALRRMLFTKVLSSEIARRRGHVDPDGDSDGDTAWTRLGLTSSFSSVLSKRPQGPMPGAIRAISYRYFIH